jgi:RNA polymerase sigma factor (sigma-70 family)
MLLVTDNTLTFPTLSDDGFRAELALIVPQLRAFGRTLAGDRDVADDLVQDTLLRAWTFIILRNLFLSQVRRNRFRGEWDEQVAERTLSAPAAQDKPIELGDVYRALQQLPETQREAIILIGAGGMSYEEASEICGAAVGTVKSRVARGRLALYAALASSGIPSRRGGSAGEGVLEAIMQQVRTISGDV